MFKKILRSRFFKAGYELRTGIVDGNEYGGKDFEMTSAFNMRGNYIGNSKDAHRLCVKRGILPELRTPNQNVCSVGYSHKNGKWYGWSHRAIFGFKVGSECLIGSCGFRARNKTEFYKFIKFSYSGKFYKFIRRPRGIRVLFSNQKTNTTMSHMEYYPKEWGRGEWIAKTMIEAREMACDFAEGVS